MAKRDDNILKCSFCGKGHAEVKKLIAGPTVYICNECVELCNEIIADALHEDVKSSVLPKLPAPKEIHCPRLDSATVPFAAPICRHEPVLYARSRIDSMAEQKRLYHHNTGLTGCNSSLRRVPLLQ